MADPGLHHDRSAALDDREATLARALGRLHLEGAIFLRGEYTEPWAYESLPPEDAVAVLSPGAGRVVLFHVVAAGRAWIETLDGERHWASEGDVIVLPYGDSHRMGGTEPAVCVSVSSLIDPPPWQRMPVIHHGSGGAETHLVCGYLACDDPLFDPRMRALPRVFVVRPDGAARPWVRASIDYAVQQTALIRPDHFEAPTRIPELLLAEVLRLHLADSPATETGWLQALRDPVLAPALAAMHASPEHKWTLLELARAAQVSISLLDERFRAVLGLAPIRYLTGWRMHLATDLLRSTDLGVAAVSRRVGYESEEAFSRAFKRQTGNSPSTLRTARAAS